jgi:hypothetical protein
MISLHFPGWLNLGIAPMGLSCVPTGANSGGIGPTRRPSCTSSQRYSWTTTMLSRADHMFDIAGLRGADLSKPTLNPLSIPFSM